MLLACCAGASESRPERGPRQMLGPLLACMLVVAGSALSRPALAASSPPAGAHLSLTPAFPSSTSDAALRLRGGAPGRSLDARPFAHW